jgi:hypothetical protein
MVRFLCFCMWLRCVFLLIRDCKRKGSARHCPLWRKLSNALCWTDCRLEFHDAFHESILEPHVHYRAQNSPPTCPLLNQTSSVQTLTPYFFNIPFNINPSSQPIYLRFSLILSLHLLLGLAIGIFASGFATKMKNSAITSHIFINNIEIIPTGNVILTVN